MNNSNLFKTASNINKKLLFKTTHFLFDRKILSLYDNLLDEEFTEYEILKNNQELALKEMINHCYLNVPFYSELFKKLDIVPRDIVTINDLKILPILNKEIINTNINKFIPVNIKEYKFHKGTTGGTTGTPLVYRVDHHQRIRSIALLYRGFANAGYEMGDKVFLLGGSSIGGNSKLNKLIYKFAFNFHKHSSFDMEDNSLLNYYSSFISGNFKFIRGYASSIFYFAEFIENKKLVVNKLKAVFTTSEKLHSYMRDKIESVFQCAVFDGYGLADSGLTAFECNHHKGLHIDTQNAILELIDDNGRNVLNKEGRVIGTSLYNFAFPFLRYDTGDIAEITSDTCSCGRKTQRITEIIGRTVDVLFTPDGKNIHGWFFLYIFWEHCKGIKQYQVIQEDISNIRIKIVNDSDFESKQIETIKNIVYERAPGWKLNFEFVNYIEPTNSGKYKFIINELDLDQ